MRKLFGVLLILVAIAALLVLVVVPMLPGSNDNPAVPNFMGSILCEAGERAEIEVVFTTDNDGTGYTPYTTCIGREGQRTDASGKHLGIAVIAFVVPFLIGLFTLIFSPRRLRREVTDAWDIGGEVVQTARSVFGEVKTVSGGFTSGFGSPQVEVKDGLLNVDGVEIRMDGIRPDQVKLFQGVSAGMMGGSASSASSLAERLKEIQEALNAGLISQAEYDRLRQEILDKLV